MKKRTPIIAITGGQLVHGGDEKTPFRVVREKYFRLLEKHGASGVLVNNTIDKNVLSSYAEHLDGLLLTGGGDIHPKWYHTSKNKLTGAYDMPVDEIRDQTELFLTKEFLKRGKPVLGVCRGNQMINVVFGGTLIQDIETAKKGITEKHNIPDEEGGWYIMAHDIIIDQKSNLYKLTGITEKSVNSVHHQAVDKVGRGLRVAARSPEGVIESIESVDDKTFVMGTQWHIEQLQEDILTQAIVTNFVKAVHDRISQPLETNHAAVSLFAQNDTV